MATNNSTRHQSPSETPPSGPPPSVVEGHVPRRGLSITKLFSRRHDDRNKPLSIDTSKAVESGNSRQSSTLHTNTSHSSPSTPLARARNGSEKDGGRKSQHATRVPLDSNREHWFGTPSGSGSDSDHGIMERALKRVNLNDERAGSTNRKVKRHSSILGLTTGSASTNASRVPSRKSRTTINFGHSARNSEAFTSPRSLVPLRPTMKKVMRIVVLGSRRVGKSAFLQQLAKFQDPADQPYIATIEDTYQIQTHADALDRPKEIMIFHDTAGVSDSGPPELKRSYILVADAFLIFYSTLDQESFNRMDQLKKYVEKHFGKDRKEVPIVVVGTMTDLPERKVDAAFSAHWANQAKGRDREPGLFEVSNRDRGSVVDVAYHLAGRFFHPNKDGRGFSITKKLKPEKSNAQIMMDF